MTYQEYLNRIINEGIEAAQSDYTEPKDKLKLAGSIAGFGACYGRTPVQLSDLLRWARGRTQRELRADSSDYWYWHCYELEVEWVCNCISAMAMVQGYEVIVPPAA